MNSRTDQQLLCDFIELRSEAAFDELVRRHVDFVYSAALRMVRDSHLAEDVAQSVFLAFAQNARQLTERNVFSGWLHRTTQNLAANVVRSDVRRRAREQEAFAMNELLATGPDALWEDIAPHLDAALGELSESDRDALLLRYFERKSARQMAQTLGISEEAAQKRVSRAVERLREFFSRRNVTIGASGLVVVISANAVQSAPAGLAMAISTVAAFSGKITSAAVATHATLNFMTMKSTVLMITAALVAGTGTYFAQQSSLNHARSENQSLVAAQQQLTGERDAALSAAATARDALGQSRKDGTELLRLRSEVGMLRKQTNELQTLQQENRKLGALLATAGQSAQQPDANPDDDPRRKAAIDKLNDAKSLMLGLILYASDNQSKLPGNLDQISNYLDSKYTGTNKFELVAQELLSGVTNPSATIVVREKQATLVDGVGLKAYGFADGHAEYKREPPEGFDAWEQQHIVPPP